MSRKTYKAVPGFFSQDLYDRNPLPPAVPPRFGLLDESKERWNNFRVRLTELNESAENDVTYKAFFLMRHGQGYHNVAEEKYGTKAWDDNWSKLNGDGEITWGPDPKLTSIGENQAADMAKEWKTESKFNIPLPDIIYCSPLTRAMKTCEIAFKKVIPSEQERSVIVVENCREENGVHTCDKRNTRTYIKNSFPQFLIEDGLTEDDEIWHADIRESKLHVAERAKLVLDMIFDSNSSLDYIAIVAHGGIINGILTSIGRPIYPLPTGGVLPVVIECKISN